jgi:hypothetical protein
VGGQSFEINDLGILDQNIASWNRIMDWVRELDRLRRAA